MWKNSQVLFAFRRLSKFSAWSTGQWRCQVCCKLSCRAYNWYFHSFSQPIMQLQTNEELQFSTPGSGIPRKSGNSSFKGVEMSFQGLALSALQKTESRLWLLKSADWRIHRNYRRCGWWAKMGRLTHLNHRLTRLNRAELAICLLRFFMNRYVSMR